MNLTSIFFTPFFFDFLPIFLAAVLGSLDIYQQKLS